MEADPKMVLMMLACLVRRSSGRLFVPIKEIEATVKELRGDLLIVERHDGVELVIAPKPRTNLN